MLLDNRGSIEMYAKVRNLYGKNDPRTKEAKDRATVVNPIYAVVYLAHNLYHSGQCSKDKLLKIIAKSREEEASQQKQMDSFLTEQNLFDFNGKSCKVDWYVFRQDDINYNDYDACTDICMIPWKMDKKEQSAFEKQYWINFCDPYNDGRDCTGAMFSSYMKFLRCHDRTYVIHRMLYDV